MRIAVIGAGVSGLGAAYLLSRAHDVELYERAPVAGGHVRTVHHGGLALDTGFIVHNEPNYPLLTRLFRELGVGVQAAEMSFSVSCGACGLECAGRRPFAQPGGRSTRGSSRSSPRSSGGCGRRGGRSTRRTTRSGRSTST